MPRQLRCAATFRPRPFIDNNRRSENIQVSGKTDPKNTPSVPQQAPACTCRLTVRVGVFSEAMGELDFSGWVAEQLEFYKRIGEKMIYLWSGV